jgi:hypothetical protein
MLTHLAIFILHQHHLTQTALNLKRFEQTLSGSQADKLRTDCGAAITDKVSLFGLQPQRNIC